MPVLNIKNREAHSLATQIARRTGQSLTAVVTEALRDKLTKEESKHSDRSRLVDRVLEIGHRAASRPVIDPRAPQEILGYDEHGVPR